MVLCPTARDSVAAPPTSSGLRQVQVPKRGTARLVPGGRNAALAGLPAGPRDTLAACPPVSKPFD